MPTKTELEQKANEVSARASDRVWKISVGVLAFCLGFVVQSSNAKDAFLVPGQVAGPTVIALLALLLDFGQYLLGYRAVKVALFQLETDEIDTIEHDVRGIWWRATFCAYWGKMAFTVLAALWLIAVVAKRTLETPEAFSLLW